MEGPEGPYPCQEGPQARLWQEAHHQGSHREGGVCVCGPQPVRQWNRLPAGMGVMGDGGEGTADARGRGW